MSLWQHRTLGRRIILRRCQGEGEVYRRLLGMRQKNLPQVYEAAEEDGVLLVLEEYIEGPLLSDRLETVKGDAAKVRQLGAALCDAMGCLHSRGIIHRDIKPENVILQAGHRDAEADRPDRCPGQASRPARAAPTLSASAPPPMRPPNSLASPRPTSGRISMPPGCF